MQMLSKTYEVLGALPDSHPIKCLMKEHELLLARLDELERLARPGQPLGKWQLEALASIARFLIASEPHHQREEQALFPVLRPRGAGAAADALVQEHAQIRTLQCALVGCVAALRGGQGAARADLERISALLSEVLRDHVAKEDYILYPLAIELIDDEALWRHVSRRASEVGPIPST
jgi:hemerythrin-like domain-containing protein